MSREDLVGLAKQSAKGTEQTTIEYWLPVSTAEFNPSQETIEQDETTGHRFPTGLEYGTRTFEIPLAGAARPASLPRLLSAFFGAPATTTPDASGAPTGRAHAFDPVGKAPVFHSVKGYRKDAGVTDLFFDALGNELTLSVEPNGYLLFEAGLVALEIDENEAAPSGVSLDASSRWTFDQVTAFLNVDGAGETEIAVRDFSMTYSNDVDTDQPVLGSRSMFDADFGNASLDVSFSPREALSAHYRRALAADPEDCALRILAEGATIGGAVKYALEIEIPRLQYLTAPANISAAERLGVLEVAARAAYDDATDDFVLVTVTNETAAY